MLYLVLLIALLAACSQAQDSATSAYLGQLSTSQPILLPQADRPVNVSVHLIPRRILKLDEKRQELGIDLLLIQEWKDQRLKFDFTGPFVLPRSYHDQIWKPDTYVEDQVTKPAKSDDQSSVTISEDGTVKYKTYYVISVACPMHFGRLPFDNQICRLNLSSLAYPRKNIEYHWAARHVGAEKRLKEQEISLFEIKDFTYDTFIEQYGTFERSELSLAIEFHRQFSHYFHHIFTPFVVLVNISWFTFFLHPSKVAARIIFLILLLATANILSAIVNSHLPKTTYGKAIDTWTSGCTIFIFMAIIETVVAVHFHQAKKDQEEEEAKKNDAEEQLIPGKGTPGGKWKERERKKGCAWKCSNWFTERADKIDPTGKHIILGLFHVFIFYYLIRWAFF